MDAKTTATLISAGRVAFGVGLMLAPEAIGRTWIGPAAGLAGGKAAVRAVGARDAILGLGALIAERRGGPQRGWIEAGTAADLADVAITIMGFSKLPPAGRFVTLAIAGGSAIVSGAVARSVDDGGEARQA